MKNTACQSNNSRVLIIDDDTQISEMLKDSLEFRGYEVTAVSTAREGLSQAFSFMPKVILLDLQMPKMNGFEVLEKLKEDYRTKNIPVFIISVKDDQENFDKGFGLGAREYMVKPFNMDLLEELLENNLILN